MRPYFHIGVWSYGGEGVRRAFSADLVSITEIAEHPKRTEARRRRMPDGAGKVYEEEFQLPIWFDPVANGTAPMNMAFRAVVAPLRDWLSQHPASFPPVVINLTGGAYSDASPAAVVGELMQMGTTDGNVLVFNCPISKPGGLAMPFPNDSQAAELEGLARELYDMSSTLPDRLRRQGYHVGDGARGYAFNADLVTMIDSLYIGIGQRVIQDRLEKA